MAARMRPIWEAEIPMSADSVLASWEWLQCEVGSGGSLVTVATSRRRSSGPEIRGPPGAGVILRSLDPLGIEALAPLGHVLLTHAHHLGDPAVGHSVASHQDGLRPLRQPLGGRVCPHQSLKLFPLRDAYGKGWNSRHLTPPHPGMGV